MDRLGSCRLWCLLFVILTSGFFTPRVFSSCIASLAASHYLMALWGSRRKLGGFFSGHALVWVSASALLGTGITYSGFPSWSVYGLIHYLSGDVTLAERRIARRVCDPTLATSRIVWNTSASLFLFAELVSPALSAIRPFFLAVAIGSLVIFLIRLFRRRTHLSSTQIADQIRFESVLGLALIGSRYHPVTFEQLSALHFLLWGALPLIDRGHRRSPVGYLTCSVAIAGFAFVFTPASETPLSVTLSQMYLAWALMSNFHITLSLVQDWIPKSVTFHNAAHSKEAQWLPTTP